VPDLELGRAKNPAHGDYASPAGLKLARALRESPVEVAERLAGRVRLEDAEATVGALGGYVNFRLKDGFLQGLVGSVARQREPAYGSSDLGRGQRVNLEFASVNPTGPLHIGHGRNAVLGDVLANLLAFTGHSVTREYYVNDQNTQARKFGASIYARVHGQEPPQGGYFGDYVVELAEAARGAIEGVERLPEEEAEPRLRAYAIDATLARVRGTLQTLGVRFDEWFYESRLWEEDLPMLAIHRLREAGLVVERDGALWFAPAVEDGAPEDEDRVVIRSTGEPTYFASDLGYLLSKLEVRGFDRAIDIWGADHHGYVPRMKAAVAALGFDPGRLVVILNQLVNLKEGKLSKRQGRLVTLDELVERSGVDAVRYFYLLRSPDAMMDFDLELATSRTNDNPVYYAQYAHARLANVERFSGERDLPGEADLTLLSQPWELDLARQLLHWPDAVAEAAVLLEPHRIPYYVHDLADRVHGFYQAGNRDWAHRIVVDDPSMTRARLELCRAARHTLETALGLMGVSAPDRM
jgi:arginyl-tRNA synthetase